MRRIIISIIIGIIAFFVGFFIKNWVAINVDPSINILEAISLIITALVAIYIARILEKDVQDKRIEKDMYLSKLEEVENYLKLIEEILEDKESNGIRYNSVVSVQAKCRKRKNMILTHILESANNSQKKKIQELDQEIKAEMTTLKKLLTDTPRKKCKNPDIVIKNGIVSYKESRLTSIGSSLDKLSMLLLRIKLLVNNL
jgi:hypothetical protein